MGVLILFCVIATAVALGWHNRYRIASAMRGNWVSTTRPNASHYSPRHRLGSNISKDEMHAFVYDIHHTDNLMRQLEIEDDHNGNAGV